MEMIITCIIFGSVMMLMSFFYVLLAVDEDRWMRSNNPDHNNDSPRLSKLTRVLSILFFFGFILLSFCVYDIGDSKGYQKGQEDYINGVIKYKLVPTTGYTVERIKETK